MKDIPITALVVIMLVWTSLGLLSIGAWSEHDEGTRISFNDHSPIRIEGNSGFTSANGIVGGTGSIADPYIIEGWNIDGSSKGYGISLSNTTRHVIVRDCHIHDADGAGNINVISSQGKGIVLNNVVNCIVGGNSFDGNLMSDIHLYNSKANTIMDNHCESIHAVSNIILQWSDSNTLDSNIADPNGRENDPVNGTVTTGNGILLLYDSDDNLITGNIVSNHTNDGIQVTNNGCDRNTIQRNIVTNNQRGISISGEGHIIKDNIIKENDNTGIYADMLYKGRIERNWVYSNDGSGVIVNYDGGNQAEGSNIVEHNIINDNGKDGIAVHGKDSTYRNNTVAGSAGHGFTIWKHDGNEIILNNVTENNGYGAWIKLHWQLSSTGNMIWMNNFIHNSVSTQGMDDCSGNQWNGSALGNYWSDHTTPDNDSDGIVDTPYVVNATSGIADRSPVATPFRISTLGPTIPPRIVTRDVTSVHVNDTYDVTYAVYDPLMKAGKLTWELWTNASWLSISGTRISGMPGEDDVGSYIVNVSVNDDDENTRRSFILTVIPLEDNGTGPEDPGNGTEPEEPGNGTEPEEPGNDTEPEEPGNGTEPEEPGNDTEPEEPGNGTEPEEPGNDTGPEEPGNDTEPGEDPGNDDSTWNEITNESPSVASIVVPEGSLRAGRSFILSAYALDPDLNRGDALSFDWYIEGRGHVGSGETIELTLPAGEYRVRLVVTDLYGRTREVTTGIDVLAGPDEGSWYLPIIVISVVVAILLFLVIGTFIYRRRKDGMHDDYSGTYTVHTEVPPININGPIANFQGIRTGTLDMDRPTRYNAPTMGIDPRTTVSALSITEERMIERYREEAMSGKRTPVGYRKKALRAMLERRKETLDAGSYEEISAILEE